MKKLALAIVVTIAAIAIFVSIDCATALAQETRTVSVRIVWTQGDINEGQYEGWMLGRKEDSGYFPLTGTVNGAPFDGTVDYNGDGKIERDIQIDDVDVAGKDQLIIGVLSFKSGGRESEFVASPVIDVSPARNPTDVRGALVLLKQTTLIKTTQRTTSTYGTQ